MAGKITIALGADHGGYTLKEGLKEYLLKKGYKVKDFGTYSLRPSDYPLFGHKAALYVSKKKAQRGIVICKTGFGMAIIANKLKGIRSAVCDTPMEAKSSRQHNDCNVLSLAAKRVGLKKAKKIADVFLHTKAEGGRHKRRVRQIVKLEKR
ncbi:MAG: ribose 5-phosphate isomerase B [Candidatus Omnitrophica bacterium]|nr:ribose 5-phosphate isomerase B [Candidatus Omnitrophota bacterium]